MSGQSRPGNSNDNNTRQRGCLRPAQEETRREQERRAGDAEQPGSSDAPQSPPNTALARWKALARAENAAARKIWGNPAWMDPGTRPKTAKELEVEARRRRRVEQIEAWHEAGVDIDEIARRLLVRPTTILTILRTRRRAAKRSAAESPTGDG